MTDVFDDYAGKTVLVTGGAGAIGANLVRRLNELDIAKILILDNLRTSNKWNLPRGARINFIRGDILDDEKLKLAFKDEPDIIFHLAAHFANQNSIDDPETNLMVNGMGTLKLLKFAHLFHVSRFVYASSSCVYGSGAAVPFKEDDVTIKAQTPYQITKLLGELYTNYFHSYYHLPVANARFFNSYGPGEVPGRYRNVIPNFLYWAINGKALPITGDGNETRSWTYVDDIADGLLLMGTREEAISEAINIGSDTETRVIDLADKVNRLTGNKRGVTYSNRRRWDENMRRVASIAKAKRLLNYRPQVTLEDGLKLTYRWFVENWDNIENTADF